VNEPLELAKDEERFRELTAQLMPVETPAQQGSGQPSLGASWLRLAYAVEFLVALIAILDVWSEIGGQGHLDLMPWHIKFICVFGLAWCCVRFTAGIVEQNRVWTRRTIAWLLGILLFGIAMGGITYYYHLHEDPEGDDEDTTAASIRTVKPGVFLYDARKSQDYDAHHGN